MKKHILLSSTGNKLALLINTWAQGMSHIVIACHGFLGSKENGGWIKILSDQLEKLGMGLVAFDFEGCGESEGDFADITLSRQASNLNNVINYVQQEYSLPVILLGRSFGGSTVLAGGSDRKEVAGYILWCTPVFLEATFSIIMPKEYQKLEKGEAITYLDNNRVISLKSDFIKDFPKHNMDQYLTKLKDKPVLVIHGTADKVVNPNNCFYIANQLPYAQVHLVEGADHSFSGQEQHRINLTIEWLDGIPGVIKGFN